MPTQPAVTPLLREAVRRLAPSVPLLTDLGSRFASRGFELALVGGPVRDAMLGRAGGDLDLATNARPEQTERILREWADTQWDVGRAFGTIGAQKGRSVVEVTTYRTDSYDRRTRKPSVAFGSSLTEDLKRRDFTVNAMALTLPELRFLDPQDGLADLAARRIDTPATPQESFGDDPLRMMRAARFVAQLGFALAPRVELAMRDMAGSLAIVSAERIRDELVKLILAPGPRAGIAVFVDTGLAELVLPELPALRLEIDEHHRHKDVYEHSLIVLDQAIALEDPPGAAGAASGEQIVPRPDLVLRLSALLHDIGKPATRRFEAGGGVSFHHHEVVGAKLAAKRLRQLRFDNETIKAVSRLIELHLRFHGYGSGEWTDSAVRRYVTDAGPLLARLHRLTRADCTTRNARKAGRLSRQYDSLETRISALLAQEELRAVRPDLDGHEIGELLGIPPGPELGRAYKHMLSVRLDRGPLDKADARAELLRWWQTQTPDRGAAGETG